LPGCITSCFKIFVSNLVKLLQYPVGKLRSTLVSRSFLDLVTFKQNVLLKFGILQVDGGKLNFNSQVCFGSIKNP
jgi:hypothetical protein